MKTPAEAAAKLTEASVRGNFDGVRRAVKELSDSLIPALAALPRDEAARRLDDACSLIEWSRRNLCSARARLANEIRRLDCIDRYHQRLAEAGRQWPG